MPKARSLVKVGISVGLLAFIAYLLDWSKALSLLREASLSEFALGLGLLLAAYLVNGSRLIGLQKRVDLVMPAPLFWGSYYTGLLFNYVLPSGVGGDAVRVVLLTRRGYSLGALAISGMVDRLFGLLGLFAIGGIALLMVPSGLPFDIVDSRIVAAGILLVTVLGMWWLPRLGALVLSRWGNRKTGRWGTKLESGSRLVQRIFSRPGRMLVPVALSLLSHGLVILSYASCGRSLLPDITLAHYLIAIPGVMLAHALPISLGGLGVREVSTVGLLVWLGAEQQAALTLSLAFLVISWISVIPGVFTAVHYGFRSIKVQEYSNGS